VRGLSGCLAGAVEEAAGGADVHVEGDAVAGVAGHAGDVGGVESSWTRPSSATPGQ
jgi:hypothetical protein